MCPRLPGPLGWEKGVVALLYATLNGFSNGISRSSLLKLRASPSCITRTAIF